MEVFYYLDYRAFLKDWYQAKKAENPKFSYRILAKKVGFQSAGFFTQILQGKTKISQHIMEGFCDCIGFGKKEKEYFQALVLYNQSDEPARKANQKAKLEALRAVEVKTLSPPMFRFMEEWYHAVIRELVCVTPFRGDYQALAKMLRPRITPQEAQASIKLLLELGMVRKNAQGLYDRVDPVISTGYDSAGPLLEKHFLTMNLLGESALHRFPRGERNLSWVTVSLSREKYADIVEELRLFRRRILQMGKSDTNPNRIYHLNLLLFPLAGLDMPEAP
jgi:uncharacterized protein (TIGR02147 family)